MMIFPANAEVSHYKVANDLLDEGVMMVHILRDCPGVILPPFCNTPIVRLNFSYRYMIKDFVCDEEGIRASLSFSGKPTFCDVPWTAVCGLSSVPKDQLFVWINLFRKEDLENYLPEELAAQYDTLLGMSVFDDYPELKQYEVQKEEIADDEDNSSPGNYAPLRFV